MSMTITVDYSQFDTVFARYVVLSKKTVSNAIRHQLSQWAYEAGQLVRVANQGEIERLRKEFKLVAWLLSRDRFGNLKPPTYFNRSTVRTFQRKRKDGSIRTVHVYEGHTAGGKMMVGAQRGRAGFRWFSRAQARLFARKHFNSRLRAMKFALTFVHMIQRATRMARGDKVFNNPDARLSSAIKSSLAEIGTGAAEQKVMAKCHYDFKHQTSAGRKSNEANAAFIETSLISAFQKTVGTIVPNMQTYIARKMQESASTAKGRA